MSTATKQVHIIKHTDLRNIAMSFKYKQITIVLLLLLMLAPGQAHGSHSLTKGDSGQSGSQHDGAMVAGGMKRFEKADYLTQTELEVIMEINRLRSNPAEYARLYLEPLREKYLGKLLKLPGRRPVRTQEGIAALEECIRELENTSPSCTLLPCKGLTLAARDLTLDQGSTKTTGHTGNDGSSMSDRIERYGQWNGSIAENISYGFDEARYIVVALLIDDGVPSRGHRKTLLDGTFNYVGVNIGPHRRFRAMCVMEFATKYSLALPKNFPADYTLSKSSKDRQPLM
ncbi:MAG: CAP domain-containing protein [Chlorobiaceae bacterium]|nr:CAP domain-containing protein [Chlorobiaceae bacterium]